MKILALEFSSEQRSAAVLDTEMAERSGAASESGGRTTRAFQLIDESLRQANLEREQIDCLAIGLGPGSYTGIRIAISVAQGWQLARDVRLLGVSSIECLAAQARMEGLRGRIHFAMDAQRHEFYVATYELSESAPRVIDALRLVAKGEIEKRLACGEVVAGPEVERTIPGSRALFPTATVLARLAATRTDFISGSQLEPIYLRETNFVKAPPIRAALPE
jgi:tRNA threonylcarbamoyl adenosine modification protein YeaZ